MSNEINFLTSASKVNYNMSFSDFSEQFYPDSLGDYVKEKFQSFRKDFFLWFRLLDLNTQAIYVEFVKDKQSEEQCKVQWIVESGAE